MRLFFVFGVCLALSLSSALADVPPPNTIPHTAGSLSKAPPVSVAAFPSYLPAPERSYKQGGDYDTRDFCSATVDIAGDEGVQASVQILGEDDSLDSYKTFPYQQSIVFKGTETPDHDHVVRRSFMLALRHNVTVFSVALIGRSIHERKNFFVTMTPVPCGAVVP